DVASIERALAATRQRLKRLAAREAALARVTGPDAAAAHDREARERLAREQAAARAEQARLRDARTAATRTEAGLRGEFGVFTDPRNGIERLDDRTPILLMPVRLETRFKTVATPGGAAPAPPPRVALHPD